MKKNIALAGIMFISLLYACGPAAEDREKMHARAKVFQDSIAASIKAQMNEAEMPNMAPPAASGPVIDTTLAGINARAAAAATAGK